MKNFDILCDALEKSLDEVTKDIQTKGLTDASLNNLHKLTDTKKNLLKIESLEGNMYNDNMGGNSYRMGGVYPQMREYSYRQGNNSNRYGNSNYYGGNSYNNGNSMDGGMDSYSYLEEAMRHARSDAEREAIRQVMTKNYQ